MTSYKLSDLDKLKRLLYLSDIDGCFVAGDPEKHSLSRSNVQELISDLVKASPSAFLGTILNVNEDELLPRRRILHYILAVALTKTEAHTTTNVRNEIATTVLKVSKSDEEFFNFIRYFTQLNPNKKTKISTAVAKVISKFFDNKDPIQFTKSITEAKSYHGWKYKDLIKISHYKTESVSKTILINYILFGIEKVENPGSEEAATIIGILQKSDLLRTTSDDFLASRLITEIHASMKQVNPKLYKSEEVWGAIIAEMNPRDVLSILPKLYKFGLLKANGVVHSKVIEVLTSIPKINESKLHPIEVFIHLKNFEKGGKPMDPKLVAYLKTKEQVPEDVTDKKNSHSNEPKCNMIVNSIKKTLKTSYTNLKPTNKRIMITVDVTDKKNDPCFKNRNISCLEGSVAIVLWLLKIEKEVIVALFKDDGIQVINIDQRSAYQQISQKFNENNSDYIIPNSPIEWAISEKKKIDIFINITHDYAFRSSIPRELKKEFNFSPSSWINKYRNKMRLYSTKLVTICLSSHNLNMSDGTANIITMCGLSTELPNALGTYINETFS